ncbi:MAG: GNAT family N-acetyltransferase [Pseudomonadota bacterium]
MGQRRVRTVVTFLELARRPSFLRSAVPPDPNLHPISIAQPDITQYRMLYDEIGRSHAWVSRKRLSDRDLTRLLHDPAIHFTRLDHGNTPIGFYELNATRLPDIEITFLGLIPTAIGRGWGRFLLTHAMDTAYGIGAKRLHLQTCTLDHPTALGLYRRAGFRPYKMRSIDLSVPAQDFEAITQFEKTAS